MKVFAAALLLVLAGLQYRLWVSDDGLRSVLNLRRSVAAQKAENASLTQRNAQLAAEVKDLKGGTAAVEERARTDLGMVGRDETFYQIVEQDMHPENHDPAPPKGEPQPVPTTAR